MKAVDKRVLWFAAALTGVMFFIILILPGIVRDAAIEKIEQATGRKAAISRITLNPFTMTAEVTGFRLSEKGGGITFASFSSARVKISPASVTKRALIVSRLRLTSPYLRLERSAPNVYNFSDLIPAKKPADGGKFLFSVNNIEIGNGAVDFLDRAATRPTGHTVRRMDVSIPFISNITYLADIDVAPSLSAYINGARFSAQGRLKPLKRAAETSAIIILKNADLPFYASYIPFSMPITVKSGTLATSVEFTYRVSADARPELSVTGTISMKKLLVTERGGAPLLALGMGSARCNRLDIMARRFDLASLETAELELYPERDEKGVWTWQRLFPGDRTPAAEDEKRKKGLPLLKIDRVIGRRGKIRFRDRLPAGGFSTELEKVNLDVKGFSTGKGKTASLDLSFGSARGESVTVKGELGAAPPSFKARVDTRSIDLGAYHPYLAGQLASPVTGKADTSATVTFDKEIGLLLDGVSVAVHGLAAEFGDKEGIRLSEISLSGGKIDLKQRIAEVESVMLSGGDVRLSRDKEGRISYERLLVRKPGDKGKTAAEAQPSSPFNYRVKEIRGEKLDITFRDGTREGNPAFPLKRLGFSLEDVAGPKSSQIPFRLATAYGNKGNIGASGALLPSPLKVRGSISLKRIPIRDFDAYLPENLAVSVAGGEVDSKLTFDLAKRDGKLTGSYGGSLGVRSFYCLDTTENEDLLKWERLQLEGIKGALAPFSIGIGEISLSNFFSRIVITENGTLNLQNLIKEKPGAPPAPKAARTDGEESTAGERPKIRIGAVTLQGGTMVFSDRHIRTPFTTTFHNLGGKVSGLSSETARAAEVDLRGNLENRSPLTISGSINPLRKDLFVDLTINFSDIDLTPASPYTGTYLGYVVDKGKLFLALKYHIENKELTSENKIFFDQLTFGNRVESDKATSLPVRLAVALLKDRKGEIHLDIPVTGRTDDPQFSIWRLVFKVLRNLLVKAATSPFTLLQAAFGGTEDFSQVNFAPGSPEIPPGEREKLLKLAEALRDRPALNMEITGYVDREKDPEGYRGELLARKMRTERFLEMVDDKRNIPGQTPDTTGIPAEEYSRYLKAVYRKEKFPKPRNLIGMLKDLPDDEMKKLIFTHTAAGQTEMQALARQRTAAVHSFLVEKGNLPKERLFLKTGDINKSPEEDRIASRVEFGALVK